MKKMITLYTSWRNDVLFAIMAIGLILLFAECESLLTLLATKIAAIGCGFVFAALFSKWETEGKLTELANLINEED